MILSFACVSSLSVFSLVIVRKIVRRHRDIRQVLRIRPMSTVQKQKDDVRRFVKKFDLEAGFDGPFWVHLIIGLKTRISARIMFTRLKRIVPAAGPAAGTESVRSSNKNRGYFGR